MACAKKCLAIKRFFGINRLLQEVYPKVWGNLSTFVHLTKKDSFEWNSATAEAFQKLKSTMASPQVLALLDFSKPFEIECDASGYGIGAILQQGKRSIAFTSQSLDPQNQALSTYERELIAIVYAIKKWQTYLQGRHFVIKIDHNSLKYYLNQNTHFQ